MSRVAWRSFKDRSYLRPASISSRTFAQLCERDFHLPHQQNRNEHITALLEKNALVHYGWNDEPGLYKYHGYRSAINVLKNWPKKIESGEEAKQMKYIGKSLAAKIDEIIKSGTLQCLDELRLKAIRDLRRVPPIGYDDAKALYQQGISSIEDLKRNTHLLTKEQADTLEWLDLIEMEIARDEALEIEAFLKHTFYGNDPSFIIESVGAYRRKSPILGGMDFIMAHPHFSNVVRKETDNDSVPHPLVAIFLHALKQSGVLKANLAPRERYKFVGLLQSKKGDKARLIRLHMVTTEEYPFALLYLTGTPRYTRQVKGRAVGLGYSNKEYGLNKAKDQGGNAILVQSEEEIFEILNMVYAPPTHRATISRQTPLPVMESTSGDLMGDGWGMPLNLPAGLKPLGPPLWLMDT